VGQKLQGSRPHSSWELERVPQGAQGESEDAAADGSPGQGGRGVSTAVAGVGIQAAEIWDLDGTRHSFGADLLHLYPSNGRKCRIPGHHVMQGQVNNYNFPPIRERCGCGFGFVHSPFRSERHTPAGPLGGPNLWSGGIPGCWAMWGGGGPMGGPPCG